MEPGLAKDRRLNVTSAVEIARSTSDQKLRVELAREVVERSLGVLETHSLLTSKVKSYAHFSTSPNEGKVDGRRRKVSDNYYIWRAHLERSLHDLNLHSGNFEIATLYDTRPSEELDRQRDLKIITFLIQKLEGIRKQVSETSRQRFERTGSV